MSKHPTHHPRNEPSSFTQAGTNFWWTYNPDAELGKGEGLGHFDGEWATWRDNPEGNGNRYLLALPVERVPDWALSRSKHLF